MALQYDGTNDYVEFTPGALAGGRSEVSMCFWVRLNTQAGTDTIYDEWFTPNWWQFSILVGTWYTRTTVTGQTGARDDDVSMPTLTNGVWHHLAFVYSVAEGRKTVYLDGAFAAESTTTIDTLSSPPTENRFGFPGDGTYLDGEIADARFYTRVLTLAEIQSIHAGQGGDRIRNGILAGWEMNEQAPGVTASGVGTIRDSGDSAIHGDPTNGPVYSGGEFRSRKKVH